MRNNVTKLSVEQIGNLQTQTKMEAWMNGVGMGIAKVIFWVVLFLSIVVESNGQSMTFAKNDVNQTPKGIAISGNVLSNDSDPTHDDQWVTSVAFYSGQSNVYSGQIGGRAFEVSDINGIPAGTMSIFLDGNYEFIPTTTFKGKVNIKYTIEDASGATDNATLVINVIPPNHPIRNNKPIAINDTNTTEMDMDVAGNVISFNDFDLENDALTLSAAFSDADGGGTLGESLVIGEEAEVYGKSMAGDPVFAGIIILNADGNYYFDPVAGFSGKLPIKYEVSDGNGGVGRANLTISVLPTVGNHSFANDDISFGKVNMRHTGNILANDQNLESDFLVINSAACNRDNILTLDGITANELRTGGSLRIDTDGAYTYFPPQGFIGTESIEYIICGNDESDAPCDTATLYLTTLPFNGGAIGGGGGSIGHGHGHGHGRRRSGGPLSESEFMLGNISEKVADFTLYPNPGIVENGFINLRYKSISDKAGIQIFDMNGRLIRQLTVDTDINQVNNLEINVTDLIEGRYHLQLIDGINVHSETFILVDKN